MATPFISERDYTGSQRGRGRWIAFVVVALILLFGARYIASTIIDYEWWREMRQVQTWYSLLLYGTLPLALATLFFFAAFFLAFRAGTRRERPGDAIRFLRSPLVARLTALVLLVFSLGLANAAISNWTVVRFFGSVQVSSPPGEYIDPIFGRPLHFYLFDLPFYQTLLRVLILAAVFSILIYWLTSNAEILRRSMPSVTDRGQFEFQSLSFGELVDSSFIRLLAAILLAGLAVHFYLLRYGMLLDDHGSYLVGIDWVAEHVALPLQWLLILASLAAVCLVLARRPAMVLPLLLVLPVRYLLPPLVTALYVRPNELALERPYIQQHIAATRAAYGLQTRVTETGLDAKAEIPLNYERHKATLENVRLWDWRAFHDTVSQIQPLRPYVYSDTDVDRYTIDGQLRQVLVSPRELDIRQLGEARNRWINPHLIYTHGYGIVMAEANRITPDGLPVLFIQDAPPVVNAKSLKFNKPEIYFSEIAHEPVFVDTKQQEFNYPTTGSQQPVQTTYKGTGGFELSFINRIAAALHFGDVNILISGYLTDQSRLMIHRAIRERLANLAAFVQWDQDPYLVVNDAGNLVWIVDGYVTSDAHPYSRSTQMSDGLELNYIRNSVKATVDAYSGETHLYVFDPGDVILQAYARLLPKLFEPASSMPSPLRAHVRYAETLFRVQAEIYRSFHMRDPESFYNRSDLWDLARTGTRAGEDGSSPVQPTYVVATLPGQSKPEFILITPFTPANKHNLIGYMAARCDGEHLGELVFEQLEKQNIVFGPMQIDARINQDQTISKDLSLWNQQGSQVLRGQTVVLPIENSFLFVEPIYIQSSQASMPQLKKVALAMGNLLAYADIYEQALAQLIAASHGSGAPTPEDAAPATAVSTTSAASDESARKLEGIRGHLTRYRELGAQGKWADAGRELDEIQKLAAK